MNMQQQVPGSLRLVIEVVTLTSGRTAYLVTRRGDLAVLFDAANLEAAQAYIRQRA